MTTVSTSNTAARGSVRAPEGVTTGAEGEAGTRREQRFADGIRTLRAGAAGFRLDERLLMVLGGVLVPMGAIVVLLGWWGAAHTSYVFDQIPYVISGGLLGVGMIFLGGFLYFAHWLTQLVQDNRRQAAALLDALQRLDERLTSAGISAGSNASSSQGAGYLAGSAETLVATARGTMAHRPDCTVVAGKTGLREVSALDGLSTCKLCSAA